jgi:hypothetical protein
MLSTNSKAATVRTVLRVDMVVAGNRMQKGAVVELARKDFVYLSQHDRVAEATAENISAVQAEVKAEKEAAKRAAVQLSTEDALRAENAQLRAELVAAKKVR